MSEEPKRIWVQENGAVGPEKIFSDDVEYIRADLVEIAIEAMKTAESVFIRYSIHHIMKGDEEKADNNAVLASHMRHALNLLEEPNGRE